MDQTVLAKGPDRIHTIFYGCLVVKVVETSEVAKVEGITLNVWFNKNSLEKYALEIRMLLGALPRAFKQAGGASFLQAALDMNGVQWTGFHLRMEQLFLLGMGIGKVECPVPREFWNTLPGGMPFYQVK